MSDKEFNNRLKKSSNFHKPLFRYSQVRVYVKSLDWRRFTLKDQENHFFGEIFKTVSFFVYLCVLLTFNTKDRRWIKLRKEAGDGRLMDGLNIFLTIVYKH